MKYIAYLSHLSCFTLVVSFLLLGLQKRQLVCIKDIFILKTKQFLNQCFYWVQFDYQYNSLVYYVLLNAKLLLTYQKVTFHVQVTRPPSVCTPLTEKLRPVKCHYKLTEEGGAAANQLFFSRCRAVRARESQPLFSLGRKNVSQQVWKGKNGHETRKRVENEEEVGLQKLDWGLGIYQTPFIRNNLFHI